MRVDTPKGRFYRVNNRQGDEVLYPSVTTILEVIGKDLIPWALRECTSHIRRNTSLERPLSRAEFDGLLLDAMRQPQQRLEEACSFGTEAHLHAARYIQGQGLPELERLGPRMRSWCVRFREWWDRSGLTCILSEQMVWSDEFRYAGTVDCVAADAAGNLYIVDFKSSHGLHWAGAYILHGIAWKMALWENAELASGDLFTHEIATADLLIVRIGERDSSLDVLRVDQLDHAQYFRAFVAARTLFDWQADSPRLVEKALHQAAISPLRAGAPSR